MTEEHEETSTCNHTPVNQLDENGVIMNDNAKYHQEFISRSLDVKACVGKLADQYELIIYQWSETEVDDNGCPLWEKTAGPFLLDDAEEAEKHAIENLQIIAGEAVDQTIPDDLFNEVQNLVGHDDFCFFKPIQFQVFYLENPSEENPSNEKLIELTPEKVLFIDNFYFTEHKNQWKMGFLISSGQIKSFRTYDTIKEAIQEINDEEEL